MRDLPWQGVALMVIFHLDLIWLGQFHPVLASSLYSAGISTLAVWEIERAIKKVFKWISRKLIHFAFWGDFP